MSRNVVVYVSGPDHRGPGHVYVVDPFRMIFCHDPILVDANISDALYLGEGTLVLGNQVPDSINGYISAYDTAGVMIWSIVVGGFASGGRLYPVPGRDDLAIGLISHQNERDSLQSTLYLLAPARGDVISQRNFVNKIRGLIVFGTTGESDIQILAFPDSGGISVLDSMLSTVRAVRLGGPLHDIRIPRSAIDQPYRPVLKGSNELLWLDRKAKAGSTASIPPLTVCRASPLPPIDNEEGRWFLVGYGPQSRNAGLIAYATLTRIPPYRAIGASGLVILVVLAVVVVLQQRRARGMMQYVAAFRGLDEQGALGFSRDGKLLVCLGIARRFCEVGRGRRRGHWHEVILPTFTGLAKAIATLQSSQSDFERSFVLTDRSDEWIMLARGKLVADPRSRVQRILYLSPENRSWRRLKDETFSVLHDLKARLGTLARAFEKKGMERASLAHVVPELQEITESLSEVMKLGQILNPRQDPIDLPCTVEAVVTKIRAVFPQVTWVIGGDCQGVVYGDERLIKRLLSVLLHNAAEALAEQDESVVTISVNNDCYRFDPSRPTLEQPAVALEVADNGPGMPPEMLSLAFAKPISSKGDTRGHGLLDVRKIVDAHAAGLVWTSTSAGTVVRIYFQQLTA
ncbi:hypothetical protein HZB60_00500 [candidate division KSB1 bacterium]|nr:hypothetical protein [candidate division KSB1 bacterium]